MITYASGTDIAVIVATARDARIVLTYEEGERHDVSTIVAAILCRYVNHPDRQVALLEGKHPQEPGDDLVHLGTLTVEDGTWAEFSVGLLNRNDGTIEEIPAGELPHLIADAIATAARDISTDQ